MPLARQLAPRATLLGVRGRSNEEGISRWFRRLSMTQFDQNDIQAEARAFDAFIDGAITAYGLDPERMTYLGYSNGANFIGAVMGLFPQRVKRAILWRAMAALDPLPDADLTGTQTLMLTGGADPYGQYAPPLADWLRVSGSTLEAQTTEAGHALVQQDLERTAAWLAR